MRLAIFVVALMAAMPAAAQKMYQPEGKGKKLLTLTVSAENG